MESEGFGVLGFRVYGSLTLDRKIQNITMSLVSYTDIYECMYVAPVLCNGPT